MKKLPINKDVETKKVLKKLSAAHRYLAELKGVVASIPNESIYNKYIGSTGSKRQLCN